VVEGSAALTILAYLAWLKFGGQWNQTSSAPGVWYSVLTGITPLTVWTGMVETELFAQTYESYGVATVRYPVLEATATVESFENGWASRCGC
jgi:hypothetical protein